MVSDWLNDYGIQRVVRRGLREKKSVSAHVNNTVLISFRVFVVLLTQLTDWRSWVEGLGYGWERGDGVERWGLGRVVWVGV